MRTVGVEEELLLVDPGRGRPTSLLSRALQADTDDGSSPDEVQGAVEHELQRQQIETQTPPVTSLTELATEVSRWRHEAAVVGARSGALLAATATSPVDSDLVISDSRRYQWMVDRYQLTAREHLVCGLHVHVSVDSPDEAVGVLDRIRVWLPVLLALSSNSPFWHGQDTGFASYRAQVMARWPSWGATEVFGSYAAYRTLVDQLVGSGVLLDEGMIYFAARVSAKYPTVEIRVADVCLCAEDSVTLAGLCRGLVETTASDWAQGRPAPAVPAALLRAAIWQASRAGIGGSLVDPVESTPQPAWSVVEALVEHARPALSSAGDLSRVVEGLEHIRARGTGADAQRDAFRWGGQVSDVVQRIVELTTAGL